MFHQAGCWEISIDEEGNFAVTVKAQAAIAGAGTILYDGGEHALLLRTTGATPHKADSGTSEKSSGSIVVTGERGMGLPQDIGWCVEANGVQTLILEDTQDDRNDIILDYVHPATRESLLHCESITVVETDEGESPLQEYSASIVRVASLVFKTSRLVSMPEGQKIRFPDPISNIFP
jgi:hypothetical protein